MIRALARPGLRITARAQRVGCDRTTVRTSLADPEPPRDTARPPRVSTLAPCTSSGQQRLARGVSHGDVRSREVGARGDDGKHTRRRASGPPRRRAARHHAWGRCEIPPGHPGQVDWGHGGTIGPAGRPRRLSGVARPLGASRALAAECTVARGRRALWRGHRQALASLGGVPEHRRHDPQQPGVQPHDPGGAHRWTAGSLDVAEHEGVGPTLGRPDRAPPTGQGDRGLPSSRRNGWPACPDVPARDALNEALGGWLAAGAKGRRPGTTQAVPRGRLAPEPRRPVHVTPDDLSRVSPRWRRQAGCRREGGHREAGPAGEAFRQRPVRETPEGRLDV